MLTVITNPLFNRSYLACPKELVTYVRVKIETNRIINKNVRCTTRGRIFSHVRLLYEWALGDQGNTCERTSGDQDFCIISHKSPTKSWLVSEFWRTNFQEKISFPAMDNKYVIISDRGLGRLFIYFSPHIYNIL